MCHGSSRHSRAREKCSDWVTIMKIRLITIEYVVPTTEVDCYGVERKVADPLYAVEKKMLAIWMTLLVAQEK